MIKMMREAIEAMRDLPEERQDKVARAILDFASDDDDVYHLIADERIGVGRASASRAGH